MFFPVKIAQATGAWIRAVAIEDDWLTSREIELIDLSLPIMNRSFEPVKSRVVTSHHDESRRARAKRLGMRVEEMVHLGAMDHVETYTHAGTHVDAPYRFGPGVDGQRARTVDELPLEWFYGDGVLLDLSPKAPGERISAADVQGELERVGCRLGGGKIVLLRTGAANHFADDPAFTELSPRLDREALVWLLEQGVRVVGFGAESLDGPVGPMVEALRAGDRAAFFPIHRLGREREFCLIAKMDLARLTRSYGFKVAAFPIKLGAAARAGPEPWH